MAGPQAVAGVAEARDTRLPGHAEMPGSRRARPDAAGPALPAVTDRIPVRFEGEGAGVEELSWGQLEIWTAMQRQRNWMPIGNALPLPAGTTVTDVAAELRFLLGRYQSARTRLRFDADGVRQVVAGAGEAALEVLDAAPEADPAAVAERVRRQYGERDYDFAAQWPVRMAVVRHHGVPTHKVLVMCHLVTDAAGAAQMAAELAGWRRARAGAGPPVPPLTAMQPMAQARWQRSDAGRRVDEAARRHWEGILRTIRPRRFGGSPAPRRPRHWLGELDSPAMWLAVRAVARRLRVATGSILLTAYAVGLSRVTGGDPVVVQVITNNRFRPRLAGTVGQTSQTGLCVLDVAGMTFAEAVTHVRRRALTAYKYAYYDPLRMDELVARIGAERGQEIDIACYFNDRRAAERPETGPVPAPAQVRAALPLTAFQWRQREDRSFEHLFVHIENVPDRSVVTVAGDTHCLAPADMEACVRGMERVVVEAAAGSES